MSEIDKIETKLNSIIISKRRVNFVETKSNFWVYLSFLLAS